METITRCITGRHKTAEIRWHLAILAVGYWALVFCAWRGYQSEHTYSVMTETLSALGSFDDHHNPQWYWVFSIAMVYCGLAMMPIILYIRRSVSTVSGLGANIGAFLFLVGCAAIVLTGLFPYAHGKVFGNWQFRQIHMQTAVTIAVGFGLGVIWHGILLFRDMLTKGTFREEGKLAYLKIIGPFSVCVPVFIAVGYKIHWESIAAALHAAVHASTNQISADLGTAFHGLRSFPLLEHMAIWGLTIFVIWFAAVLPRKSEQI